MNLQTLSNTILLEGGISYSITYGKVTKGYAVCADPDRSQIVPVSQFNTLTLQNFVNENSDLLAEHDKMIGGWVHEENVYLDVTSHVTGRHKAVKLATLHHQLAYYDLNNNQTVWL